MSKFTCRGRCSQFFIPVVGLMYDIPMLSRSFLRISDSELLLPSSEDFSVERRELSLAVRLEGIGRASEPRGPTRAELRLRAL